MKGKPFCYSLRPIIIAVVFTGLPLLAIGLDTPVKPFFAKIGMTVTSLIFWLVSPEEEETRGVKSNSGDGKEKTESRKNQKHFVAIAGFRG